MQISSLVINKLKEALSIINPSGAEGVDNETRIIGSNGVLDSLAFVTFLVSLEQEINQKFNASISLQNEKAFSQSKSPFRSVKDLSVFIAVLLEEVE